LIFYKIWLFKVICQDPYYPFLHLLPSIGDGIIPFVLIVPFGHDFFLLLFAAKHQGLDLTFAAS
jgi:hypothetical protein